MRYLSTDSAKNTLIVGAYEGGRILYNSFLGSKTAQDIHVVDSWMMIRIKEIRIFQEKSTGVVKRYTGID